MMFNFSKNNTFMRRKGISFDVRTSYLGSTKVLTLLELDVEEAICALVSLIYVLHHRIRGQNFLAINEKRDGSLFAQAHSFSNNLMELDSLKVIWNEEPVKK